ncbi:hypothetical protein MTR_7g111310 [Medicago truncatula]|uniref:Uncharacterized protein n=1 Tax=Medicago truncatula TaxID=3880 RepID=G7KVK3_MEDTR|nr:hypothetical protein MTR_7g111310 [Medicago truncatula]
MQLTTVCSFQRLLTTVRLFPNGSWDKMPLLQNMVESYPAISEKAVGKEVKSDLKKAEYSAPISIEEKVATNDDKEHLILLKDLQERQMMKSRRLRQ